MLAAPYDVVVKASGLAAGKGVLLPASKEEAVRGLHTIMVERAFGVEAGAQVVVEERLLGGEECSVLAWTDGHHIVPFPPAQDHKRIADGDLVCRHGGRVVGVGV